jgi:1,4-alpha-glucan branching enzyme
VLRTTIWTWILAMSVLTGCAVGLEPRPPFSETGGVRFTVRTPSVQSVAVAGGFNGWSASSHPMTRVGPDGVWSLVIPLPPGEHSFMYVVNDTQWLTPPQADDYVEDGFGNRNGLVIVREREGRR